MSVTEENEITRWLIGLKAGDEESAQAIWDKYFERLVRLARDLLQARLKAVDEEDIALSAMNSLMMGARDNRFPKLNDRGDLWKLLLVITGRKVVKHQRRHFAGKRLDAHLQGQPPNDDDDLLAHVLSSEPSPELAAEFAEQVRQRLAALDDEEQQHIAIARLAGYKNREIAEQLGWHEHKVERKLRLIRKIWAEEE